jgi:riboflavin biosynthesis pyrimidine reductase
VILDQPLETLFEEPSLPCYEMPGALLEAYGGALGFRRPCLFANFVTSVDGVVGLAEPTESGHLISKSSRADRFVMGLLRACADTLIIGAGTFRKVHGAVFSAEAIFPPGAEAFTALRQRLGLPPRPRFVVVTRGGNIDTAEPALDGALIVTSRIGENALRGRLSPNTEVVALGADTVLLGDVMTLLRKRGAETILTEGGPSIFAEAVRAGIVDELFVTTSPLLYGRYGNDRRKSLTDGLDLAGTPMNLLGAKRHGSYLFLRYAFTAGK